MFDKFLGKAFTDVLWPLWTKALTKAASPRVWTRCIHRSAEQVGIDPRLATNLSSLPALQRLLINTFKPDREVPTASDFAVAIAFELHQEDFVCTFDEKLSATEIRHWAANARQYWLNTIIESPVLRVRYKEIRDKHPATAIASDASCMPEIENILGDRVSLLTAYFGSFSVPNATETVYVWLPSEDQAVHWDLDRRLVVPVALNTTQGADRGFFRTGHDYSLNDQDPAEWLHICYLDRRRLMETGMFGSRLIGSETDHVLWVR